MSDNGYHNGSVDLPKELIKYLPEFGEKFYSSVELNVDGRGVTVTAVVADAADDDYVGKYVMTEELAKELCSIIGENIVSFTILIEHQQMTFTDRTYTKTKTIDEVLSVMEKHDVLGSS